MLLRGICRWGSRSARLEVNVVLAILYAPKGQKPHELRVLAIPDLLSAAAETAIHEAEELASVLRKGNSTLGRQIQPKRDDVSGDVRNTSWHFLIHTQKTGDPAFLPLRIVHTISGMDGLEAGRRRNRGTDAGGRVQEIRGEGRSRAPLPPRTGDATTGAGRHFRAGSRHPGERPRSRPEALQQVVAGASSQHRPAHDGALSDSAVTIAVTL
jgi:hypothetical protein